MSDQFEIPEDLPPVPDGYVYAGLGKDLSDHHNDGAALANDWSGSRWFRTGLIGRWAANNHYAVRADSDLGREILAKRSKPSWGGALSGYPDLLIPAHIADELTTDELMPIFKEAVFLGYRIEWSDSGLRGWKGESE